MEELGNYQIRIVNRKPFCEQETGCTEGIGTCREGVCSPGHFLKGAESNFLENQINWYYA